MATGPVFIDGGLASLTALNARLVAQLSDESTSVAEESAETTILDAGTAGTEPPPDPDTGEDTPEVRGRFSAEDPFGFRRVTEWIEQTIFQGSPSGRAPLIGAFVNEWAEDLFPDATRDAEGNIIQAFPDDLAERLLGDEGFQNGAAWLPVREQLDSLPATFRTALEDENGEVVDYLVQNNPLTGPEFIEERVFPEFVEERIPNLRAPSRSRNFPIERASDAASDRAIARAAADRSPIPVETPSDSASDRAIARAAGAAQPETIAVETISASDRAIARAVNRNRASLPYVDGDALIEALQPASSGGGGGRGGGGGGGVRRDLVFDRDQLVAQVADLWNRRMLQATDAPAGTVGSWVDSYIREARAFWSGKGGQLDFDTYINGKLEAHPRYQQIYADKLPGESPEQFLQKFMAPIAGFGQSGEFTRAETERSILSGGSVEGQVQRVSRTRDVQQSSAGNFSQRLAQTFAGLGVG